MKKKDFQKVERLGSLVQKTSAEVHKLFTAYLREEDVYKAGRLLKLRSKETDKMLTLQRSYTSAVRSFYFVH